MLGDNAKLSVHWIKHTLSRRMEERIDAANDERARRRIEEWEYDDDDNDEKDDELDEDGIRMAQFTI